jgi:hypothetical protein
MTPGSGSWSSSAPACTLKVIDGTSRDGDGLRMDGHAVSMVAARRARGVMSPSMVEKVTSF